MTVRRTFVDGPFGQVHCRVANAGSRDAKPAVMLHMSPKSGRLFTDVMPCLATDRTVIAPDNPGHGESGLPPAEPHVTIADYAQSAWAAVDALVDTPVHFIGYHTGSMVAACAAMQRAADVASITMISAPVLSDDEARTLQQTYEPIPIDEAGSRFKIMWQRVLEHRGPGMTLQMAAASFAENLRAGDDYEWGHRAAFDYATQYTEHLRALTQPVYIMNPADDCFELSRRADALLQNGRRDDFPHWGHGFLSAYPDDAAAAILQFVTQHD